MTFPTCRPSRPDAEPSDRNPRRLTAAGEHHRTPILNLDEVRSHLVDRLQPALPQQIANSLITDLSFATAPHPGFGVPAQGQAVTDAIAVAESLPSALNWLAC